MEDDDSETITAPEAVVTMIIMALPYLIVY